jgi:hypothetical protein
MFTDVSVDITTIYTVVKRNVGGTDRYYVEWFDDAVKTDSAVTGTTASIVTVQHLRTEECNVILDELVQANETADTDGLITFPRASTASYEVGLPIEVKIVTMPIEIRIQSGSRIGFKKRIVEVNAMVYETQHMKVNGIEVPFRQFDTAGILDSKVPEYTGLKVVNGILGYSNDAKITVTQEYPLKFTLLGMEYKVAVHQGT